MPVDTSSYQQPEGKSVLDVAQQFGQMKQQQLNIDKSKFDQANQALTYVTRAMAALGPNATKEQYKQAGAQAVQMGLVPPAMLNVWNQKIDAAPTPKAAFDEFMTAAAQHQEVINYHLGSPVSQDNQQGTVIGRIPVKTGQFEPTTVIPRQIPPTQPVVDPNSGQPQLYGTGQQQGPIALPVGPRAGVQGPSTNFGGNVISATVEPPSLPATPPVGRGPVIGLSPGQTKAREITGAGSGTMLAEARNRAASFQRDIFPLMEAIPALESLGTKGTGPGTETINNIKSFILSNLPGINEKDPAFASVATYDKAKKYLTDFVNQTGSTGTNDKLAAAFAGNPSVGISNAAAVDVAKSALALRRMQQAQLLEFERTGLPDEEYAKWVANRTNELDPRAFGIDMMGSEAKKKLLERLDKNKKERELFNKSAQIAIDLGFISPR